MGIKNWSTKRKIVVSSCALLAIAGGAFFGPTIGQLWPVIKAFFEKVPERKYLGTSRDNLAALYVGFKLYHESEGVFPNSDRWMDEIKTRIRANDMQEVEALKKLHNPAFPSNKFGYAMNDAVSGKFKGDIKDSSTILIYESKGGEWNAHGSPAGHKGLALTVEGKVVEIKD